MLNHNVDQCCGTTCDKKSNLEYIANLERDVDLLRHELAGSISLLKLFATKNELVMNRIYTAISALNAVEHWRLP